MARNHITPTLCLSNEQLQYNVAAQINATYRRKKQILRRPACPYSNLHGSRPPGTTSNPIDIAPPRLVEQLRGCDYIYYGLQPFELAQGGGNSH